MKITEEDFKSFLKVYQLVLERAGWEEELQEWWVKINSDPDIALQEWIAYLETLKPSRPVLTALNNAKDVARGENWMEPDFKGSVTQLISNSLMKMAGLGVLRPGGRTGKEQKDIERKKRKEGKKGKKPPQIESTLTPDTIAESIE